MRQLVVGNARVFGHVLRNDIVEVFRETRDERRLEVELRVDAAEAKRISHHCCGKFGQSIVESHLEIAEGAIGLVITS